MWNSYWGRLERVKTLLEMGLVSIDDKDAVSLLAVAHAFYLLTLAMPAYFNLTLQDGRTMLDYAMIGKKNKRGFQAKHDELIAFLQSCSCLPESNHSFLFHILVIISLSPEL
jgi:hypothetical protein